MVRVLIVDDSLLAEHALKSYFMKLDHEVIGLAKTGEIGQEMYEEYEPDLVTVDAVMPGMSGQDYIKYLNKKEKEKGKKTTILMISSDEISEEEASQIRVDKYLVKPITLDKMRQALEEIL